MDRHALPQEANSLRLNLLINAGGQSRRMGQDKALLRHPISQEPLIRVLLRRFQPIIRGRCVVVSSSPAVAAALDGAATVEIVADCWPVGGALGGVATGLARCEGWTMVLACDMPFADPSLMLELARQITPADAAVIPVVAGRAQPFHGFWHAAVATTLAAKIEAGQLAVGRALQQLPTRWVDYAGPRWMRAVENVNTPEEWQAVCARLDDAEPGAGQEPVT
jgi:molybdopterin-guanine dinucleotide biosynthesis protein A